MYKCAMNKCDGTFPRTKATQNKFECKFYTGKFGRWKGNRHNSYLVLDSFLNFTISLSLKQSYTYKYDFGQLQRKCFHVRLYQVTVQVEMKASCSCSKRFDLRNEVSSYVRHLFWSGAICCMIVWICAEYSVLRWEIINSFGSVSDVSFHFQFYFFSKENTQQLFKNSK